MSWDLARNANTNRNADFIGTENQPLSLNTRSTSTFGRGVIMRMSLMSSFVLVFAIAMAQALLGRHFASPLPLFQSLVSC